MKFNKLFFVLSSLCALNHAVAAFDDVHNSTFRYAPYFNCAVVQEGNKHYVNAQVKFQNFQVTTENGFKHYAKNVGVPSEHWIVPSRSFPSKFEAKKYCTKISSRLPKKAPKKIAYDESYSYQYVPAFRVRSAQYRERIVEGVSYLTYLEPATWIIRYEFYPYFGGYRFGAEPIASDFDLGPMIFNPDTE